MDPRAVLSSGVSTGLRLGRGTADRVVRIAGPTLGRLSGKLVSRARRPEPAQTTTFTPSKAAEPDVAEPPAPPASPEAAAPSPGKVARNIGPRRPTATPAQAQASRPKSVPGAKLPPPRPTAT